MPRHTTDDMTNLDALRTDGFTIVKDVAPAAALDDLRATLDTEPATANVRGILKRCPAARPVSTAPSVTDLAEAVLGRGAFVVRAILFDKTPDANWSLRWHQDTTIPVHERIETSGFGPWSVKDGVPHVRPPAGVLERMITIRVAIDHCDDDNGPLLVLPGSHTKGFVDGDVRHDWPREPVACTCRAGDAVLMRPLLLHSSGKAVSPRHRRVLHLEFGRDALPGGLEWAVEA